MHDARAQVESGQLGDEPLANFEFALGKAFEDRKDYDRAFDFYDRGNSNRRQRERYDPVQTADSHDEFIRVYLTRSFSPSTRTAGTTAMHRFSSSACRGPVRP